MIINPTKIIATILTSVFCITSCQPINNGLDSVGNFLKTNKVLKAITCNDRHEDNKCPTGEQKSRDGYGRQDNRVSL